MLRDNIKIPATKQQKEALRTELLNHVKDNDWSELQTMAYKKHLNHVLGLEHAKPLDTSNLPQNMSNTYLHGIEFTGLDLSGKNFSGADLHEAFIKDCNFTGCDFTDTLLNEDIFLLNNEFNGTTLTKTRIYDNYKGCAKTPDSSAMIIREHMGTLGIKTAKTSKTSIDEAYKFLPAFKVTAITISAAFAVNAAISMFNSISDDSTEQKHPSTSIEETFTPP